MGVDSNPRYRMKLEWVLEASSAPGLATSVLGCGLLRDFRVGDRVVGLRVKEAQDNNYILTEMEIFWYIDRYRAMELCISFN